MEEDRRRVELRLDHKVSDSLVCGSSIRVDNNGPFLFG